MRWWSGLLVLALVAGACGGGAAETEPEPAPGERPSLASGITAFQNLFLGSTEQINDRDAVPLVDRILVSPPDGAGMVTVTGSPGAVPYGQPDRRWSFVDRRMA